MIDFILLLNFCFIAFIFCFVRETRLFLQNVWDGWFLDDGFGRWIHLGISRILDFFLLNFCFIAFIF